jgi:hypothetical protein
MELVQAFLMEGMGKIMSLKVFKKLTIIGFNFYDGC